MDIPADYNGGIGFYVGGFVSFNVSEKISIRPELLFSQRGSSFSINGTDIKVFTLDDAFFFTSIDGDIKESLILLPIILKYKLSQKFVLGGGPQLSHSLSRNVEFDNNPFNIGFIRNDGSEKFEIGVDLELEYVITNSYGIELRYNYGITERQNLHSSIIQLGMNYRF